jgi:hypothetical protein
MSAFKFCIQSSFYILEVWPFFGPKLLVNNNWATLANPTKTLFHVSYPGVICNQSISCLNHDERNDLRPVSCGSLLVCHDLVKD